MIEGEIRQFVPLPDVIQGRLRSYVTMQQANGIDIRGDVEKLTMLARFKSFPRWISSTHAFRTFVDAPKDPQTHYIIKGTLPEGPFFVGGQGYEMFFYMPQLVCSLCAASEIPSATLIGDPLEDPDVFNSYTGQGLYEYKSGKPSEYLLLGMYGSYLNDPFNVNITPYLDELLKQQA